MRSYASTQLRTYQQAVAAPPAPWTEADEDQLLARPFSVDPVALYEHLLTLPSRSTGSLVAARAGAGAPGDAEVAAALAKAEHAGRPSRDQDVQELFTGLPRPYRIALMRVPGAQRLFGDVFTTHTHSALRERA